MVKNLIFFQLFVVFHICSYLFVAFLGFAECSCVFLARAPYDSPPKQCFGRSFSIFQRFFGGFGIIFYVFSDFCWEVLGAVLEGKTHQKQRKRSNTYKSKETPIKLIFFKGVWVFAGRALGENPWKSQGKSKEKHSKT